MKQVSSAKHDRHHTEHTNNEIKTYLCMSSVGWIETGLAICGGGMASLKSSGISAAEIPIEMLPENATDAVQSHRIDAGVQKTATQIIYSLMSGRRTGKIIIWGFPLTNNNSKCFLSRKSSRRTTLNKSVTLYLTFPILFSYLVRILRIEFIIIEVHFNCLCILHFAFDKLHKNPYIISLFISLIFYGYFSS